MNKVFKELHSYCHEMALTRYVLNKECKNVIFLFA